MYNSVVSVNFSDIENIINEYNVKKANTVYPIINVLIARLNDKITNRDLHSTTSGYFYDSWYFWQKIKYHYMGFKIVYSKTGVTLTNWACATILKHELERTNKLAHITVEILDVDDNDAMVLINIGLREDGKPFEGYVYAY